MKKRVVSLLLCLIMALSLIPTVAFAAEGDPPTGDNSTGAGEVSVKKIAEPVEGMVNTWKITLTVTAKDPTPLPPNAQDVVLVIDNSNSMHDKAEYGWYDKNRMYYAQNAAKTFIDSLLPAGSGNRVAIVYFGKDAHSDSKFYTVNKKDTAKSVVDQISKFGLLDDDDGGTNIQTALDYAVNLLKDSTNNNKNIVLLSDGKPTYAKEEDGNYVGNGLTMQSSETFEKINSLTVASADNARKTATLYSVSFLSDSEIMTKCSDKSYSVKNNDDVSKLSKVFETVAVEINGACKGASVTDTMSPGFEVVSVDGATVANNVLTWNVGDVVNETKTLTYRVTVNDNILTANKAQDGFYPTNVSATLSYIDENKASASMDFPVPTVPVTTFTVKKVMDNAPADATFDINLTNGSTVKTYSLKAGEKTTVVPSAKEGNGFGTAATWTVSETVAAGYAAPSIMVNGQASAQLVLAATSTLTANVTHAVVVTNAKAVTPPTDYKANITITKNIIKGATSSSTPGTATFTFKAEAFYNDQWVSLNCTGNKITTTGVGSKDGTIAVVIPTEYFKNNNMVKVRITEVNDKQDNWTYSTNSYEVYVKLNGDGTTSLEVTPNSSKVFTNTYTYTPPTRPTNPIRRQPTTTTKPVQSVKTGDMGIALYAVTSLLSLSGTALLIKKRKDEK